ncbi:type I phosphomannose isomerase catalytic subunit [Dysgonomonas sp. HGC4]|uniref:type I phosphomannose isomerase catalytic subunit n=1 Tax=Dysgonomonas sp. HGC4 TaxID=1658009 RepID=UPI000681298E|nr:type I phosphomannose isomerase catalytic subunit [Dysgonomonas sp. HGC4]MBD8348000.1 class I mannose-6-phosphate isomerase [Dysgonomonas sp. HGC4]
MNLYPLKFSPILKPIIWGGSDICKFKGITPQQDGIGESWEISGVENNISVVDNGDLRGLNLQNLIAQYKESLVGKHVFEKFGATFPLLIKFIDARDNLSIQVHPDDELGMKRHNSFGKTEMWYVINAAPGAFLYSGFAKPLSPDEYVKSIEDNTFVDYLAKHDVKKGDSFFLPAGRVHAIGAGTFIAEIQQTSNITYRIYDYNRKDANGNGRELHTELAKDAIDFKLYDNYQIDYSHKANDTVQLESCKYFTTNLLELDKPHTQDHSDKDSFIIYICMDGSCEIKDSNNTTIELKQGETLLVPAANTKSITITPNSYVQLLETYV